MNKLIFVPTILGVAAALAIGCGDQEKSGHWNTSGATGEVPARPPAGLKPISSPHGSKTMEGSAPPDQANMPVLKTPKAPEGMDFSGLGRARGGYTIEELYARRADLSGKDVKVRGRVIKFNPEIMGANWLHVQDGTGAPGSNDLTVTTSSTPDVGDTVLVEGPLAVNQTLGHGMTYPVLIQDARVIVEQNY